jgi:adenylosuccinate synthase
MDYWKEKSARTPIGTTQKGIGLAYADKALRDGLRVCDATDPVMFAEKVERLIYKHVELISAMHPHAGKPTSSAVREWCSKMVKLVSKLHEDGMVVDGINYLHRQLRDGKSVLVEGANGAMLDIDMGTYPFVTSSSTTIGGVLTGLGLNAGHIGEVIGVMKAYVTRVGGGPFPTELTDVEHGGLRIPGTSETWIGSHMQTTGKEIGVTTGRKRRCGWLDAVALSHAIRINGYTSLNATKGDVLDALPYIRVCVAYKMPDGTTTNEFPSTDCNPVPIYQTFKGWETSTVACRKFSDLPQNAQRYYLGLQTLTGLPIRWIGTGPSRNDMIML